MIIGWILHVGENNSDTVSESDEGEPLVQDDNSEDQMDSHIHNEGRGIISDELLHFQVIKEPYQPHSKNAFPKRK